jgi:ABC-type multidrug transport system fused ATPase/permease subunit
MIPLFDRRRTRQLGAVLAFALVQLAATIVVARALHGSVPGVWLVAGVAALIGFGSEIVLRRLSEGLGLSYVTAVREALFRHLMELDPAVVQQRRHGAMLQSFVGDLTALRQWVAEGIMRAILAVVALCGLLGWLTIVAPRLAGVAAGVLAIACLAGGALLKPLSRAVLDVRRQRGRVSAFASERLGVSATVLACGRTGSEARRLVRRAERLNRASLTRAWLTGTLRALPHLATAAIVIGAVGVGQGMPVGHMAGFVLVIGVIGIAMRDLARAAELVVPGLVSYNRIKGLMALPQLQGPVATSRVRGEANRLVLDRLVLGQGLAAMSAVAEKGDIVLLDGDPHAGRILFRTVAGLAHPEQGTIRWNGTDLCAGSRSHRRRTVGVACAELPLLRGSNGLNLRYRAADAEPDEASALAAEWGINLRASDADPERLSLLRALLGHPPVLLLAPGDLTLADSDAARLAAVIGNWPGVVVLVSRHPLLVRMAKRRWTICDGGVVDQPIVHPTLAPISRECAA